MSEEQLSLILLMERIGLNGILSELSAVCKMKTKSARASKDWIEFRRWDQHAITLDITAAMIAEDDERFNRSLDPWKKP